MRSSAAFSPSVASSPPSLYGHGAREHEILALEAVRPLVATRGACAHKLLKGAQGSRGRWRASGMSLERAISATKAPSMSRVGDRAARSPCSPRSGSGPGR